MNETYYAGVYWGARKESAQECAQRFQKCLVDISAWDDVYARWFKGGTSIQEAQQHEVHPDEKELETFLSERPNSRGTSFIAGLWTGQDEEAEAGTVSVICGEGEPAIPNNCIVELPRSGIAKTHMLNVPKLIKLLEYLIVAWEPDWGVVMSRSYQEVARKPPHFHSPDVGWLTYLSASRGAIPFLPQPIRVVPIAHLGSMIITTEELFTASNPRHFQLADEVMSTLTRAGLMNALLPTKRQVSRA